MKKLISLILCAMLVLGLAACGETEFTPVTDGAVVGSGSTTFPLTIVDDQGNAISITVKTDKATVGKALQELGLLEGTESEYGLYITEVNGIYADYNETGTYWSFYINDDYATTGVDQTPIADGESYKLAVASADDF